MASISGTDMNDDRLQNIGKQLFKGAWGWLMWQLLFVMMGMAAYLYFAGDFDYDDTDGHSTRSGMKLRVDYGTGCQYLETRDGGIIQRFGSNGQHICAAREATEVDNG